jgi:hypothetical protein
VQILSLTAISRPERGCLRPVNGLVDALSNAEDEKAYSGMSTSVNPSQTALAI